MTGTCYRESGPLGHTSSYSTPTTYRTETQEQPRTVSQSPGNAMSSRRPTVEDSGSTNCNPALKQYGGDESRGMSSPYIVLRTRTKRCTTSDKNRFASVARAKSSLDGSSHASYPVIFSRRRLLRRLIWTASSKSDDRLRISYTHRKVQVTLETDWSAVRGSTFNHLIHLHSKICIPRDWKLAVAC